MTSNLARKLVFNSLRGWKAGCVRILFEDQRWEFGERGCGLQATLSIHNERFFRRALCGGDVALGESYMDGEWSTSDLVALSRIAVRNLTRMEERNRWLHSFSRVANRLAHRLRRNSLSGSRRNIGAHYDLSDEFFELFLDPSMTYSCAIFERENDSLETAQQKKLERVCRKLRLQRSDHVLEIGTGWGGFAAHAARNYGCRVTTTTISRSQFDHAGRRFKALNDSGRIDLLLADYRELTGKYDKVVSIEMFEAVGLENYDAFFGACDRLLRPGGAMFLQTITMNEQRFPVYRRQSDWIQKYIFPGGELASVKEILGSLGRTTGLSLHHAENIGAHYAQTLAAWRRRFLSALGDVRRLGFNNRFIRMWEYYLATCEGAFLEGHIGNFQLLLLKNGVYAPPAAPPGRDAATEGDRRPGKRPGKEMERVFSQGG